MNSRVRKKTISLFMILKKCIKKSNSFSLEKIFNPSKYQ